MRVSRPPSLVFHEAGKGSELTRPEARGGITVIASAFCEAISFLRGFFDEDRVTLCVLEACLVEHDRSGGGISVNQARHNETADLLGRIAPAGISMTRFRRFVASKFASGALRGETWQPLSDLVHVTVLFVPPEIDITNRPLRILKSHRAFGKPH